MSKKKHTNINSLVDSVRGNFEKIDCNNLNPPKKKKQRNAKPRDPDEHHFCTGTYAGFISG